MNKDLNKLNFKWAKGYEGLYKVSDCGVVLSVERIAPTLGKKGRKISQKIKSQRLDRYGYLRTELSKDGKVKTEMIHQLVLKTFKGLPKGETNQVNHIDGVKRNNHISNLEWVTVKENINHAWETGLREPTKQDKGYNHKKAKLNKEQYQFILGSDLSYRKLGAMFGVHHSIIYGIKKGTRYNVEN